MRGNIGNVMKILSKSHALVYSDFETVKRKKILRIHVCKKHNEEEKKSAR